MLAHHHLWPPRQLRGKAGILEYIQRVGCIQYDPINVVGRNPDLVLQSRIANYRPEMLEALLYEDRALLDQWDKMMAVYAVQDWPYLKRLREAHRSYYKRRFKESPEYLPKVRQALKERGPLSSIDLEHDAIVDWAWGPTRAARAALELLYYSGELIVHHKVNTRRVYDLIERHMPEELLSMPDPHASEEDYHDWHVLRRVGGLGLAQPGSGEQWLGIPGMKSSQRQATLRRLTDDGKVIPLQIEEMEDKVFFMRGADRPTLEKVQDQAPPRPKAAFVGALDNLMWDRKLVNWLFDFDYVWEVYKPVPQRKYGYYVLPVIYGDRFVGRLDPAFDKKTGELTIQQWWWEPDVKPSKAMGTALKVCMRAFIRYLNASRLTLSKEIQGDKTPAWLADLAD